MRKASALTFILIMVFLTVFFGFVGAARGQTVEMTIEDVQQLRKAAAETDYQRKRADEAERQSKAWEDSATRWRGLYESEKRRADEVQGGRVEELRQAAENYRLEAVEYKKAVQKLEDQAKRDRDQIGQLNFDVQKLKSERKYLFLAGVGTGAAAGGFAGYQIGKRAPSLLGGEGFNAARRVEGQTFGFRLQF